MSKREADAYVSRMEQAGRRWFGKPPPGFPAPGPKVSATVGCIGSHFASSPENRRQELTFAMLPRATSTLTLFQHAAIQRWMRGNSPSYYPDAELVRDLVNTDALSTVEARDVRVSVRSAYIALPEEAAYVSPVSGDKLNHLFIAYHDQGDMPSVTINGHEHRNLVIEGRRLLLVGFWERTAEASSYLLPLDVEGRPLSEVIDATSRQYITDELRQAQMTEGALVAERGEITDLGGWLAGLVVNLLLVMQTYPTYVEALPGHARQRYGRSGATPTAARIARPVTQTVVETRRLAAGSADRGVALHWRRGHWRRQPHLQAWADAHPDSHVVTLADGRSAHMAWIEPVLVGQERGHEQDGAERGGQATDEGAARGHPDGEG